MKRLLLLISLFVPSVHAHTIYDAWDPTSNATILSNSGTTSGSNISSMFDDSDTNHTFFRDDKRAGFIHYVEWQTESPIDLVGFHFRAYDDNSATAGDRGITLFNLYASNTGVNDFQLVSSYSPPSNPYPNNTVNITTNFSTVTAQFFRAEFVQFADVNFPGPRITELSAITVSAVPVPAAFWLFGSGLIGLIGIARGKKT